MKKVTKYINTLNNLYSAIGNQWVDQNSLVLNYAKNSKLVIGGSIALAIGAANPHKIPGDIDLFTNNNDDALNFIAYLTKYLSEKKGSFYRIDVNNETPRVLPGVLNHYRIKVPFWKPICVMTVSKPIRKYFYHGAPVQFYDDVIAAAKEASKIDNKNRLPKEEQDAETVKKFQKWTNAKIQRVSIESIPAEDVQVTSISYPDDIIWWNSNGERRGGNVVRVDRNTFEPYISINILTNDPHQSRQVEISADYYRSRMDEAIRRLPLREGESDEELALRINTWIYHSQPNIAQPQRLRTNWAIDAAQDLQTMHDNIGQELVRIIDRDINRELLEFAREQRFDDPYSHCESTLVS